MSSVRLAFSRLVAIGGFTVLTGATTYAHYDQCNFLRKGAAECSPASAEFYDGNCHIHPNIMRKRWDDNWDLHESGSDAVSNRNTILKDDKVEVTDDKSSTTDTPEGQPKPTATRHVILVRHGQYVYNADDDSLCMLTDIGRQQATLTGERLKALGIKFDGMVISTMRRALETGGLIGEFLPKVEITNCSLLREGAPYPVEPKSINWNPSERTFFTDNPRIEGAFRKYIHRADPKQKEDSYELLVCHGNVIRYFVCRALQFPPEGWLRMSVANCGITWLAIRPNGRVSLRVLGDSGHLPPHLITYN